MELTKITGNKFQRSEFRYKLIFIKLNENIMKIMKMKINQFRGISGTII